MVKTFQSSRKSFATSIASSISSFASGLLSIFTFPASLISTVLAPTKDGKKALKVTLRVTYPKWMKLVDWFVNIGRPAIQVHN
jgi:hypothetical protein